MGNEKLPPIWTPKTTARAEGPSDANVIQSNVAFKKFTTAEAITVSISQSKIPKETFRTTHAWTNIQTSRKFRNTLAYNQNQNQITATHKSNMNMNMNVLNGKSYRRIDWAGNGKYSDPQQRGSKNDTTYLASGRAKRREIQNEMRIWGREKRIEVKNGKEWQVGKFDCVFGLMNDQRARMKPRHALLPLT